MKYMQFLGTSALIMVLAACGQIQVPEAKPDTETLQPTTVYGKINGTVFSGDTNYRVANAEIFLNRFIGGNWVNLGKKATSDSSGNYIINNVATGYTYRVKATKKYPPCAYGYVPADLGTSPSRSLTSNLTLWVRLKIAVNLPC